MMKRLFDLMADIRITFYILLAIAVIMFAGSLFSAANPAMFRGMNGQPVQDWFFKRGMWRLAQAWWVPLLYLAFGALWVNLAACSAKRISVLWPRRKIIPRKQFIVLLTPTYVHLVFLVILFAHFITFTLASQTVIPIEKGTSVKLTGNIELRVKEIRHDLFPEESSLNGHIRGSSVIFDCNNNGVISSRTAGFIDPVYINGHWILIEMRKNGKPAAPAGVTKEQGGKQNQDINETGLPGLNFLVVRDPGLILLVVCFIQIVIAMGWFYFQVNKDELSEHSAD